MTPEREREDAEKLAKATRHPEFNFLIRVDDGTGQPKYPIDIFFGESTETLVSRLAAAERELKALRITLRDVRHLVEKC